MDMDDTGRKATTMTGDQRIQRMMRIESAMGALDRAAELVQAGDRDGARQRVLEAASAIRRIKDPQLADIAIELTELTTRDTLPIRAIVAEAHELYRHPMYWQGSQDKLR